MPREEIEKLRQELLKISERAEREFGSLTAEQLNWKPAPERWSVAQCFHHLITTNEAYFPTVDAVAKGQKKTVFMERLPVLPKVWAKLLIKSLDPKSERRIKAPAKFQPSSSDLPVSIITDFVAHQQQLAGFIAATLHLDVDSIIITSPAASAVTYSLSDAYRILVVHEHRHFQQAQRVTEAKEFPRSTRSSMAAR